MWCSHGDGSDGVQLSGPVLLLGAHSHAGLSLGFRNSISCSFFSRKLQHYWSKDHILLAIVFIEILGSPKGEAHILPGWVAEFSRSFC